MIPTTVYPLFSLYLGAAMTAFWEPEPAPDLLSPPLPDTLQAVAEPKQRCVEPTSGNLKLLFNVVFCTFHTKHRIK